MKRKKERKKKVLSSFWNFLPFHFQFSIFPFTTFLLFFSIFPLFNFSLPLFPVGQQKKSWGALCPLPPPPVTPLLISTSFCGGQPDSDGGLALSCLSYYAHFHCFASLPAYKGKTKNMKPKKFICIRKKCFRISSSVDISKVHMHISFRVELTCGSYSHLQPSSLTTLDST